MNPEDHPVKSELVSFFSGSSTCFGGCLLLFSGIVLYNAMPKLILIFWFFTVNRYWFSFLMSEFMVYKLLGSFVDGLN